MHPKQMRHLMRKPHAMLKHQMTGELPRMIRPQSPLITLLRSLTPHDRLRYRGVQLGPALGYRCGHRFHNAEQLLKWLAPADQMLENEPWPAESFRDKHFRRSLSLTDLQKASAQHPGKAGSDG